MTSVLYGGSLNYQIGNPIRFEINKLTTAISDLKKIVDTQNLEIVSIKKSAGDFDQLKGQVANLERMNRDLMATIATLQSRGS
jgi:hypothetical protein